jgi:hypothetical protein
VFLQPTATTLTTGGTLVGCIVASPQTATYRSDSFTFRQGKTGTANLLTLDVNGNATLTGDLTVTGQEITAGSAGEIIVTREVGATASVFSPLTLRMTSTGTPAAGTGTSLEFQTETAVGVNTTAGIIQLRSTDVTPGSESFNMNFRVRSAGVEQERMQLDNAGNLQIDGDLTVTGNEIKSSGGTTAITLSGADIAVTSNIASTTGNISTFTGSINASGAFDSNEALSATANLADTNTLAGSSIGITTKYWTDSTKTTLSVPQFGNKLGNFRFNSNSDSANTYVLGAQINAEASENWSYFSSTGSSISGTTLTIGTMATGGVVAIGQTLIGTGITAGTKITANISGSGSGSTWTVNTSQTVGPIAIEGGANGSRVIFFANRQGENWTTGHTNVISAAPESASISSDVITLENSAGTDYAVLNSTSATFSQPIGFPVKTAAAWNAITGAVGQQVCVSDSPVVAGKMAYWSSTATAGWRYIDTNTAI